MLCSSIHDGATLTSDKKTTAGNERCSSYAMDEDDEDDSSSLDLVERMEEVPRG